MAQRGDCRGRFGARINQVLVQRAQYPVASCIYAPDLVASLPRGLDDAAGSRVDDSSDAARLRVESVLFHRWFALGDSYSHGEEHSKAMFDAQSGCR